MSTFTGGALKLKGGVVLQKKKFKKEDPSKTVDKAQAALAQLGEEGGSDLAGKDKDGFSIPSVPVADKRTEQVRNRRCYFRDVVFLYLRTERAVDSGICAFMLCFIHFSDWGFLLQEKRRDEALKKREAEIIKKAASKSYRERVRDYNDYLASLSEHVSLYESSLRNASFVAVLFHSCFGFTLSKFYRISLPNL